MRIENTLELTESDLFIFLMRDVFYEIPFQSAVKTILGEFINEEFGSLTSLVIYT